MAVRTVSAGQVLPAPIRCLYNAAHHKWKSISVAAAPTFEFPSQAYFLRLKHVTQISKWRLCQLNLFSNFGYAERLHYSGTGKVKVIGEYILIRSVFFGCCTKPPTRPFAPSLLPPGCRRCCCLFACGDRRLIPTRW